MTSEQKALLLRIINLHIQTLESMGRESGIQASRYGQIQTDIVNLIQIIKLLKLEGENGVERAEFYKYGRAR